MEEIAPIRKGQKFIRFSCKGGTKIFIVDKLNKDGSAVLRLTSADAVPEEERRKVAKEIVKVIKSDLKKQVDRMVEDALTLKRIETLEEIKGKVKKGTKPKLGARPGCVFLEVGKTETQL